MVRGAKITGQLDLRGIEVPFPLRFDDCEFLEALMLDGAQLHEIALLRCHVPCGLQANGLQVTRDLDLSGSRISGALWTSASTSKQSSVWLCEAEIGGRLLCVGTVIRPGGVRAIHADRLRVAGSVRLINGFAAHGEIRLLGATIDGSLDMTGAQVRHPGQLAVDLADITIGGSFFLIDDSQTGKPAIHGRMDMGAARIAGQMIVRNAELGTPGALPPVGPYASRRSGGTAVSAPRMVVNGDLSFQENCHVSGGIDLSLGEFGHIQFDQHCVLDAPGSISLDLTNAELRSSLVLQKGVQVAGTVYLDSMSIRGRLTLRGVRLSNPERKSLLFARAIRVEGDCEMQELDAIGGDLNLRGAELGNNLDLEAATLSNPKGYTLRLHHAAVRGSVRLVKNFTSNGRLVLSRSVIDGRLDLRDGYFECSDPDMNTIQAEATLARGGMYLGWTSAESKVDFTDSQTTILADTPDSWPRHFVIRGMTYERFGSLIADGPPNWDAQKRIAWLNRQSSFDAGPYEQAAKVFRQHGHVSASEDILINQRRRARRAATQQATKAQGRAFADRFYGAFGYGYRPGRAGWPLLLLLLGVFVLTALPSGSEMMRATDPRGNVYSPSGRLVTAAPMAPPPKDIVTPSGRVGDFAVPATSAPAADPCGNGQVRCFNAFFYTIDTVVPLVSLGQRSTWYPDPHAGHGWILDWVLGFATLLGWAFSSILVLSFARLARSA